MREAIDRLKQEALAAGTWICVPADDLKPTRINEQFWLLHHTYVPKIIATLPDEFCHIASVLNALLATDIAPNHQPCFVDKTWLVCIHRTNDAEKLIALQEQLACGLVSAMADTLATGVLTSVAFERLPDACTPLSLWLSEMREDVDTDVWGEALQ
jgi:hypothetical protein